MHFSTTAISLTAVAAASLAWAQSFTVATPSSLITCQPIQLSWSGGTPPYFPRVTQGGGTTNTLKSFDQQSGTTLTWNVDIASGTSVTITVSDSTGITQGSAPVTINQGGTSCLGSSSSSGGGSGGASSSSGGSSSSSASRSSSSSASRSSSSSSAPSSSASSAAGSSSTARPSTSAASSSSAAAAAATTSSGSGNGAESVRGYSAVVAGVVGVAAAALL